ncbi:MAG: arginyl-tRNA synthetase [Patescibacteria group bacterium]|nr:arginyl-tRNA synthetase [Patescibacteria group bacterium]
MSDAHQMITSINAIKELLKKSIHQLNIDTNIVVKVENPAQPEFGDYATSVALSIFSEHKTSAEFAALYSSPRAVADTLVEEIKNLTNESGTQMFSKIEVAGPGFINFTLAPQYLLQFAQQLVTHQAKLPTAPKSFGSVIIEYLGPNTNKPLHIGHLRNGALGLALGNLLQEQGWDVHFATINNDRGLHIMKSVWGYLELARKTDDAEVKPWHSLLAEWKEEPECWLVPSEMPDERLKKPDHFVGHWYILADGKAEDPDVQAAWAEMLQTWENSEAEHYHQLRELWQTMNNWFYEGSRVTAGRLGITFEADHISYESKIYEAGKQIVLDGAEKGIFKKLEDGAIKVELEEQYGLPDKILLRRDGTGIYMTFDIELTRQRSQYGAEKLIWVVGVDQQLYFQQLFAVAEKLGFAKRENLHHFAYGMVRLPEGKMSSRKGRVVYADDLLDMAREKAAQVMDETHVAKTFSAEEKAAVIDVVGTGAVKWTMLSQDPVSEITFDINESVSFKGFAGPYIQYTAARCHSVIEKAKNSISNLEIDLLMNLLMQYSDSKQKEEVDVLRNLVKYFDAVERAAQNYSPHILAVYLFELSQAFNAFYAHCPIVDESNKEQSERRLVITAAVETVLNRGLTLLGITPVEKM